MSGWQTVYLDTVNEMNARAAATQLGSDLKAGEYSAGDENYCFRAYTPLTGHDDVTWSYTVLARVNADRFEGLAACNAVPATSYVKAPTNPSNAWAGT